MKRKILISALLALTCSTGFTATGVEYRLELSEDLAVRVIVLVA